MCEWWVSFKYKSTATTKLEWLLSHALLLHQTCLSLNDEIVQSEAYVLLKRLIEEQTALSEEGLIVPRPCSSKKKEK